MKAEGIRPFKNYWFQQLKQIHLVISKKEELIKRQHEANLMKNMFETWFWLQKEEENYVYLVESMDHFCNLRLKSKGLKGFIRNRDACVRKREIEKEIVLRKKYKFLRQWKIFFRNERKKKLKKGSAYEHYYFSLLRKGFYEWMPICRKIRQENQNSLTKEKYFYFWKKLFVENEENKTKVIGRLRHTIMKKAFLDVWKTYVWFTKRLNVARKFYLYRRLFELKLAVSKHKYNKDQKRKADLWFKWKAERKYFEKFYVNHKKEIKISKEYKIKAYQFVKKNEKKLLGKYFRALTCALMIRHVEEVRGDKIINKYFQKWAKITYNQKLRRHMKKEFNKRMKLAKYYKCFNVLKLDWINMKKKEYLGYEVWRYKKQRRVFKLLHAIVLYNWKEREMRSEEFYRRLLMQRGLYVLHLNRMAARQNHMLEEKLDWFIEKKIRRLLKNIMRKLFIWAKANIKYRQNTTALVYSVFFNLKLNSKLKKFELSTEFVN